MNQGFTLCFNHQTWRTLKTLETLISNWTSNVLCVKLLRNLHYNNHLSFHFLSILLLELSINIWVRDDSLLRQDVNKMLGQVELVLSKSDLNISLMILLLQIFVRYLPQEGLPPQKSSFLVFWRMRWLICTPNFKFVGPALHVLNKWTKIGSIWSPKYLLQIFCSFALFRKALNDFRWKLKSQLNNLR